MHVQEKGVARAALQQQPGRSDVALAQPRQTYTDAPEMLPVRPVMPVCHPFLLAYLAMLSMHDVHTLTH